MVIVRSRAMCVLVKELYLFYTSRLRYSIWYSNILMYNSSVVFQMDLTTFIHKQQCECLNESDDHPFAHCLTSGGGYLESDCDEQVRCIP